MKIRLVYTVALMLLGSCGSVQLESQYKDPNTVLFHSNKLLVVGLSPDFAVRRDFETRMQEHFTRAGIETFRSIDLFDVAFTQTQQTEADLDRVEQQLLDKDFDAILFTKVVGRETHESWARKLREIGNSYERFQEDYLLHQAIYYQRQGPEVPTNYHTETSLYCICVGKDRSLIWRSNIRVDHPRNRERAMRDYIRLLVAELEKDQVLLGTDVF